ncbi:MAG: DUF3179 domain-containing protein [Desulfobacterales bacterium]|nr:DUF3179 domain-containing protein [Desulfobacterales bacterium]
MVYSRNVEDRELTFGVSGLVYKNNLLMYDHQTESLWLQVKNAAVTGPMTGSTLTVLPSTLTTWKKWRKAHPDTVVLSENTGYNRDYSRDPYADYYESRRSIFGFARRILQGHEAKGLVAGIQLEDSSMAYPMDMLRERQKIVERIDGKTVTLALNPETNRLSIKDDTGADIPFIITYWFVWKNIHSQSGRYKADTSAP